jgi:hypothetical protein
MRIQCTPGSDLERPAPGRRRFEGIDQPGLARRVGLLPPIDRHVGCHLIRILKYLKEPRVVVVDGP